MSSVVHDLGDVDVIRRKCGHCPHNLKAWLNHDPLRDRRGERLRGSEIYAD
jgi:hypothetical protein